MKRKKEIKKKHLMKFKGITTYFFFKLDSFLVGLFNDFLKIHILNDNGVVFFEFPYWISPKI